MDKKSINKTMSDKNINSRAVFFVSNSTGITVETLGRSLLYQFSSTQFESHSLRFVDSVEKATEVVKTINKLADETGLRPIIISTLIKPELRVVLTKSHGLYLDVFDAFIAPIEAELGCEAKLGSGRVHGIVDDEYYSDRIEAVNYSLKTDDGVGAREYAKADVILTGVSRTGKTPTSLYLAMHYGLKAANYPIVDEEIVAHELPASLKQYKEKLFGLLVTPERLQSIRTKRRPDSQYSSLSQCQFEIRQTQSLFQQENIPYFDVSSMSIEEISSNIINMLKISSRIFLP